ncbi:sugar ABC transporter substrate-binding protein [Bacillus sp. SD088]|uniref:sugar ABC transporter substrate-binding protein n=1 Tax=Bacillus sp. SD088 TaxID=2782012 RepID=UPI001A977CF7|nr:sugar ABC transporter substrate-binding protein [Bacillus sp. SD088]
MRNRLSRMNGKWAFILVAFVIGLAACSNGGEKTQKTAKLEDARYEIDEETPAWELDTQENTELTWYVNGDWFNTEYGEDPITKTLKEDLKLDVKFIKGDDEKLNTLFAGKKMPDLITIFDGNSDVATKAESWALPLQELADKYDPYFYKVAQEQTLDWYQLSEGKSYGYPSFSNTAEHFEKGQVHGNDGFLIKEDIYEAIGKPDMSTPDGLLAALGEIKEKFPEVTPFAFKGFASEGDAGSLSGTLQNFLGIPIQTEDGQWYDRNLDEDYLDWIKTFNEAFKKGYISEDNFSDDNTVFEENIASGKYASVLTGGIAQLSGFLQRNYETNPDSKYIAIDGPSIGNEPMLEQAGPSGWSVTYISKDVKDPAKAIQLYTYLLSEKGQYLTTFGVEGETFEFNDDGKAVLLPEVKKMKDENPEEFKKKYRMGEFWFFGHDSFELENGENDPPESIVQIRKWAEEYLSPEYFVLANIDPDQGTAEARSLVNIKSRWASTLANLLTAKDENEFNKTLDSYKKFLDENNFDAIAEIRNEKMQENKEKLGWE